MSSHLLEAVPRGTRTAFGEAVPVCVRSSQVQTLLSKQVHKRVGSATAGYVLWEVVRTLLNPHPGGGREVSLSCVPSSYIAKHQGLAGNRVVSMGSQ